MSQFGNFKETSFEDFKSRELPLALKDYVEMWELDFRMVLELCESPIEAKLASALFCQTLDYPALWRTGNSFEYFGRSDTLEICPQYPFENYRLDFAIYKRHRYGMVSRIAVECDGHDFHERTKKQARRDRSRDRELTSSGWQVLRFTGSEIHEDANACAEQIIRQLESNDINDVQFTHRGQP